MGDMDLALKMIEEASRNGADICKFQTWSEKIKPGPWGMMEEEIYKKLNSTRKNIFLKNL